MRALGVELPGFSAKKIERRPHPPGHGFARTIPAARQLVAHGHVRVNGRRVDIPSVLVKAGDQISIAPRSQDMALVATNLATPRGWQTDWLELDTTAKTAKVRELPDAGSVLFPIEVQLVVEFYSQKV